MKHSHPVFEITNDESIPEEWRNQILDDCFNQKKDIQHEKFEIIVDFEEKKDQYLFNKKNKSFEFAIDFDAGNHKFQPKDTDSFESFQQQQQQQQQEEEEEEEEIHPHERDVVSLSSSVQLGTEYGLTKSMNMHQHSIMTEETILPPSSKCNLVSEQCTHSQYLREDSIDKQTQTYSCGTNYNYCNSADISSQTDNYVALNNYDSYNFHNEKKHEEYNTIEKLEQTNHSSHTSAFYLGKSMNKNDIKEDSIHSKQDTMILSLKKLVIVWMDECYKAMLRKNIMRDRLESFNKDTESILKIKNEALMNHEEEIQKKTNEISRINQCHQEEIKLLNDRIKLMEKNSQILEQKYAKLRMETTTQTLSTKKENTNFTRKDTLVDDEAKLKNKTSITSLPIYVNGQSLDEKDFIFKSKIELISHRVDNKHAEIKFKMNDFKDDMNDNMLPKKYCDISLVYNLKHDMIDMKNISSSIEQILQQCLLKSLNSPQIPTPLDMNEFSRFNQMKSNIHMNPQVGTENMYQDLEEYVHPEIKPDPDGIVIRCCMRSNKRQMHKKSQKKINHQSLEENAIETDLLLDTKEKTIKKLREESELYKKQFIQQTSLSERLTIENDKLENIIKKKDSELLNYRLNESKLIQKLHEIANGKSRIQHQYQEDTERLALPVTTRALTHSLTENKVETSGGSKENKVFASPSDQLSSLEILVESILTDFILEQKNHS